MSHGVAAIAFLAGLIGLGLAGCSGTAGVYNSGDEAANGSRSGVEATPRPMQVLRLTRSGPIAPQELVPRTSPQ